LRNRNNDLRAENLTDDENQPLLMVIFMILVGGLLLWLGSESLVYGSKNLAELVGIPNELIGFTLIAIGTSLPELAASIALLRKDETHMLLGNILGSNLFNIGLVGGVAGILGPIFSETPYPWLDHISMLLFTFLMVFWMRGRNLSRKHGILLLVLYGVTSATTWIANS
jgi:cation:H+ antiporter